MPRLALAAILSAALLGAAYLFEVRAANKDVAATWEAERRARWLRGLGAAVLLCGLLFAVHGAFAAIAGARAAADDAAMLHAALAPMPQVLLALSFGGGAAFAIGVLRLLVEAQAQALRVAQAQAAQDALLQELRLPLVLEEQPALHDLSSRIAEARREFIDDTNRRVAEGRTQAEKLAGVAATLDRMQEAGVRSALALEENHRKLAALEDLELRRAEVLKEGAAQLLHAAAEFTERCERAQAGFQIAAADRSHRLDEALSLALGTLRDLCAQVQGAAKGEVHAIGEASTQAVRLVTGVSRHLDKTSERLAEVFGGVQASLEELRRVKGNLDGMAVKLISTEGKGREAVEILHDLGTVLEELRGGAAEQAKAIERFMTLSRTEQNAMSMNIDRIKKLLDRPPGAPPRR